MDDKQERLTGRTSFLSRHIGTWLKVAKRFRDGFLVTAGVFYLFGYIVWAINAHRNDMGLLPALEFQYFIAGIAPVLIVLSLYLAVVGIKRLRDKMSVWFDEDVTGWKLYLSWLMFILGAVAVIHILANDAEWFKTGFPGVARRKWLIIISALMIMASYLFLRPVESNLHAGIAGSSPPRLCPCDNLPSRRTSCRAAQVGGEGLLLLASLFTAYSGIHNFRLGAVPQDSAGVRRRASAPCLSGRSQSKYRTKLSKVLCLLMLANLIRRLCARRGLKYSFRGAT